MAQKKKAKKAKTAAQKRRSQGVKTGTEQALDFIDSDIRSKGGLEKVFVKRAADLKKKDKAELKKRENSRKKRKKGI